MQSKSCHPTTNCSDSDQTNVKTVEHLFWPSASLCPIDFTTSVPFGIFPLKKKKKQSKKRKQKGHFLGAKSDKIKQSQYVAYQFWLYHYTSVTLCPGIFLQN